MSRPKNKMRTIKISTGLREDIYSKFVQFLEMQPIECTASKAAAVLIEEALMKLH